MSKKLLRATFVGCLLWASTASEGSNAAADLRPEVTVQRVELRIDVTGSVDLPGKIEIAATAYLPDPSRLANRPIVMFALPGGGLTRHYFDVQLPGREGYSEAEHHTAEGLILVAIDHLGVGDSTTTSLDTMRIEDIAKANIAAVREISRRIEEGSLAEGFPSLPTIFKVGIGQSMGGGVTIIMQGRLPTYDAIASLGYSAVRTVLPQRSEAERIRIMELQGQHARRWSDPKTLTYEDAANANIDYTYFAFWDDVPQDIIDAKLKHGYPQSSTGPNWVSRTVPNCVIAMTSPGYVAVEAANIRVPVLIALGERDVVMHPLAEPSAYQSTTDISVFIVPGLGHTHNLGSTRRILWDRLVDWSRTVSRLH